MINVFLVGSILFWLDIKKKKEKKKKTKMIKVGQSKLAKRISTWLS